MSAGLSASPARPRPDPCRYQIGTSPISMNAPPRWRHSARRSFRRLITSRLRVVCRGGQVVRLCGGAGHGEILHSGRSPAEQPVGRGTFRRASSAWRRIVRRATIAAILAAVLLAVTGCLTPLTSQQPLTPVPAPANPLVGVYEPGAPASWSGVGEFTDATGVRPGIGRVLLAMEGTVQHVIRAGGLGPRRLCPSPASA